MPSSVKQGRGKKPGQKENALASTRAMTWVGERESSSAGRRERRCNARPICYRLSLRTIPSNTTRRV
jgi:hypothetical protein